MLRIEGLNSGYGRLHILYDVSIEARRREIVAVLGPNGAGKTTLLNSIFGIADVYSGLIELDGRDITGLPPHKIARMGISYVFQTMNVFPNLTVEENLRLVTRFSNLSQRDVEESLREVYELFPILGERRRQMAGTLSGGERQMLAVAMGFVRRPLLLMLDEPTAGLAVRYVDMLLSKISEMKRAGEVSIILVEQNVQKALRVADRVYVIVSGRVVFEGIPAELLEKQDIAGLYLGVGEKT